MKRNEITIGAELYYDRSANWETTGYYASKAVVVDTERYKINRARWGYRSETTYTKDPKGNCVLVDLYDSGSDKPRREPVPVAHLRGPYEQTKAAVQGIVAAAKERETAKREQERDLWNRAGVACERADTFGITAAPRCALSSDTRIEVSVADFERLLDMVAARVAEGK